jgi:phage/plasmid-associated DNA primase
MVEGAKQFIAAGYKIDPPECVMRAIESYRTANDWLGNYLSERCEEDRAYKERAGELYSDYRFYCQSTGDYTRSAADFKAAIEGAGYETKKTKTGAFVFGLRLQSEFSSCGTQPLNGKDFSSKGDGG